MARYGMDYGRDFDRGGRWSGRFEGSERGGWGNQQGGGEWRGGRPDQGRFSGSQGRYGGMDDFGGNAGGMRGRGYGQDFGGGFQSGGYGGRDLGYGAGEYSSGGMSGEGRGRMRAAELMTENPEVVTPDATLADVARRMKELDVGIIPVVDSEESRRLRGVITDRDIAVRAVAEGMDGKAKVSDCMTSKVATANKNDPVDRVVDLMEREQVRRVPVTDREGRLVGIIAQADLAVEYTDRGHQKEHRVVDMLERVSEPARPQRGGRGNRMEAGNRNRADGE